MIFPIPSPTPTSQTMNNETILLILSFREVHKQNTFSDNLRSYTFSKISLQKRITNFKIML